MKQLRVEVCCLLVVLLLSSVPALYSSDVTLFAEAKWPKAKVVLSISGSLAEAVNISGDAAEAVHDSVAAWSKVAGVQIETVETDVRNVSQKGRGDGLSLITAASTAENVGLFPNQADSPAALTRVFSDRRGNITEADIVLNPFVKFSTDGTFGTYDLHATITHEIGHLLGLDHSPVWGSVMFAKTGPSFGAPVYSRVRREIPEVDASSLRGLYGAKAAEMSCCGIVLGRVNAISFGRKGRNISAWLEESSSGRLIAAARVSDSGSFEIGGVPEGAYRLRVAGDLGGGSVASEETLIEISVAEVIRKNFKLTGSAGSFTTELFGTSPQLARLPGVYRPHGAQSLYIGGKGLDVGVAFVHVAGTDISVGAEQFRMLSYGNSVKVISFDLPGGSNLADGTYSLVTEDINGVKRFLIGALIVSR